MLRFYPFMSKSIQIWDHFVSLVSPEESKNSKKFGHCTWGNWGKKTSKRSEQMKKKKSVNNFFCRGDFRPFWAKRLKSETTSFHYFCPRIPNLIFFGHLTLGSGGKKTFKRYLKSKQTKRQTDTRTEISTYRKHRPRGPMLLKFTEITV